MVLGKLNWYGKKMKLDHILKPLTGKSSKCIKDLYVRPQTIKVLEEIIGIKLSDIYFNNIFSDITPQARKTKEKINR